jgi:predicted solute-binding protein
MPQPTYTVAAVRFLNAKPLIDGLEMEARINLVRDVPSRLLETLINGQSDVA